jgi:hypothetical protein
MLAVLPNDQGMPVRLGILAVRIISRDGPSQFDAGGKSFAASIRTPEDSIRRHAGMKRLQVRQRLVQPQRFKLQSR